MASEALFPIIDRQYKMKTEPIVRIGVILEEDRKGLVEFEVRSEGAALLTDSNRIPANRGSYRAELAPGGGLRLLDGAGKVVLDNAPRIRLVPSPLADPKTPGDGTLVREMIAGRGFHWSKFIDQTLSHTLEFIPMNGVIVLVNELPIETYLTGVITGEMSGDCPIEFMKAQAIAARSWMLGQPRPPHPGQPYLWCNDDCCQRYQGTGGWSARAVKAIDECRAEVLITKTDHYCDARYSKSTGGISEDADAIWGSPIEGLLSRVDAPPGDETHRFFPITEKNLDEYLTGDWLKKTGAFASPNVVPENDIRQYLGRVDEIGEYFRWKKTLTQEQLKESLAKRAGVADLAEVLDLRPGGRGKSGRLRFLDVIYRATDGSEKLFRLSSEYKIRQGLSMKFLYSGAFKIEFKRDDAGRLLEVNLTGAGWGHGSGLCQIGGLGRALKGQGYAEILLHYFTDVRLERIY
ncbi:SpoIID/LytB domain-containing protein [soil metagenome]